MRAVVKHSYIKGARGVAKAKAHVKYLEYRPGEDREQGKRQFFDAQRQHVTGREVRDAVAGQERRGVVIHKLILSPGCEGVDLQAYARETLGAIGKEKGLDLDWRAIAHTNTDHDHLHVIVMGEDKKGRQVRFDRDDYKKLRELQDRYIEREHALERYLDREMSDLLKERDYAREGDRDFQAFISGRDDSEERAKRPFKDLTIERQFELMDKSTFRAAFGGAGGSREIGRRLSRQEVIRRQQGRMQEFHSDYENRQAKRYWKEVAEKDPSQADEAKKQIEYIKEVQQEQTRDSGWSGLDSLLGDRHSRAEREDKQKIQTRTHVREHIRIEQEKQRGDEEDGPRDHQGNLQ